MSCSIAKFTNYDFISFFVVITEADVAQYVIVLNILILADKCIRIIWIDLLYAWLALDDGFIWLCRLRSFLNNTLSEVLFFESPGLNTFATSRLLLPLGLRRSDTNRSWWLSNFYLVTLEIYAAELVWHLINVCVTIINSSWSWSRAAFIMIYNVVDSSILAAAMWTINWLFYVG